MHDDLPGLLTTPFTAISRRVLNRWAAAALAAGLPAALPVAGKKKGKNKQKKKCKKLGGALLKGACCQGSPRACVARCAFPTVQAAIMGAKAGSTIALCPGTYREEILFVADVRLVGAGANSTTLQGTGTSSVVNCFAPRVTLEHLKITGGEADYGGGIDTSCDMTLNDCTITGNHARIGGGGILNSVNTQFPAGAKLRLNNCTVSNNKVGTTEDGGSGGGGIVNVGGAVTLTNTVVSNNVTGPGVSGPPDGPIVIEFPSNGGGIRNDSGTFSLIGSQVRGNRGDMGGGIRNSGVLTLDAASRVTDNTANEADGGGGISNDGTVTLANTANVAGNTPTNCAGTAVPNCVG